MVVNALVAFTHEVYTIFRQLNSATNQSMVAIELRSTYSILQMGETSEKRKLEFRRTP